MRSPLEMVLVLPDAEADPDPLVAVWKAARDDAMSAYLAWRETPGAEEAAVYRAAADREEAAAAALSARAGQRRTRWLRRPGGDSR
jgi:hypothetical protein